MARSCHQDLHGQVIDAVVCEGMECRGAADRFGVGESSAIPWVREPGDILIMDNPGSHKGKAVRHAFDRQAQG